MGEHTPGPWNFDRDIWWENTPGEQEKHGSIVVFPKDGDVDLTIATVNDYFDKDVGQANARLIASAPTLKAENDRLKARVAELENAITGGEEIPTIDRLAWLETLIAEIDDGAIGRVELDQDPDADATMISKLRDLATEVRAALKQGENDQYEIRHLRHGSYRIVNQDGGVIIDGIQGHAAAIDALNNLKGETDV